MKKIIIKIQKFFDTFNETLQDFFVSNKKLMLIAGSCTIFILFITIVLITVFSKKNEPTHSKTETGGTDIKRSVSIDPNVFWLLDEPLKLPPIQFSREQRTIWDAGEIEFWYEEPSPEAMKILNKKNKKIVENILEEVP